MRLPFRRWRPWQLLLAWCVYWLGLVVVTLLPAMVAAWRVTQQSGEHGSINAGFNNGVLSATIIDSGRTIWSGSISVLPLALLIAVPPLVLWLIWLAASARTNNADERSLTEKSPSGLRAAEPRIGIIEASTSSTSKRRAREES